jgi:hypothetical protein
MRRRALLTLPLIFLTSAAAPGEEPDCERIRARLREIRSRLRAGYTAKQGRTLREQERQLNERRRRECR